jgi:hypothetical protein
MPGLGDQAAAQAGGLAESESAGRIAQLFSQNRKPFTNIVTDPGPRLTPRHATRQRYQHLVMRERPTRASAADRGVRPTNYAGCPLLEN